MNKRVLIVAKNRETFEKFAGHMIGDGKYIKVVYKTPTMICDTSGDTYYYGRLDQRYYCGISADKAYIDGRLTIEEFESIFIEVMCCLAKFDGDCCFFNVGV